MLENPFHSLHTSSEGVGTNRAMMQLSAAAAEPSSHIAAAASLAPPSTPNVDEQKLCAVCSEFETPSICRQYGLQTTLPSVSTTAHEHARAAKVSVDGQTFASISWQSDDDVDFQASSRYTNNVLRSNVQTKIAYCRGLCRKRLNMCVRETKTARSTSDTDHAVNIADINVVWQSVSADWMDRDC